MQEIVVCWTSSPRDLYDRSPKNWDFGFMEPTPRKLNMEPENDGFQKESPFPGFDF